MQYIFLFFWCLVLFLLNINGFLRILSERFVLFLDLILFFIPLITFLVFLFLLSRNHFFDSIFLFLRKIIPVFILIESLYFLAGYLFNPIEGRRLCKLFSMFLWEIQPNNRFFREKLRNFQDILCLNDAKIVHEGRQHWWQTALIQTELSTFQWTTQCVGKPGLMCFNFW